MAEETVEMTLDEFSFQRVQENVNNCDPRALYVEVEWHARDGTALSTAVLSDLALSKIEALGLSPAINHICEGLNRTVTPSPEARYPPSLPRQQPTWPTKSGNSKPNRRSPSVPTRRNNDRRNG